MSLPESITTRRPIGIKLLSILHFIGGIGFAGVAVWFAASVRTDARVMEGWARLGIPLPIVLAGLFFRAGLLVGSGVGMWKGAKWGWHLAALFYAYSIVRNTNAIVQVVDMYRSLSAEANVTMTDGISFYVVKFGGRVLISLLIYCYLFKGNVRRYFGFDDGGRWLAIAIHLFICVAIVLAIAGWATIAH
jgi:hypothetical protein